MLKLLRRIARTPKREDSKASQNDKENRIGGGNKWGVRQTF